MKIITNRVYCFFFLLTKELKHANIRKELYKTANSKKGLRRRKESERGITKKKKKILNKKLKAKHATTLSNILLQNRIKLNSIKKNKKKKTTYKLSCIKK